MRANWSGKWEYSSTVFSAYNDKTKSYKNAQFDIVFDKDAG